MGFNSNISRNEAANYLMNAIPILRDDMHELRQWTVRKNVKPIPLPISPPGFGPSIEAFKKEVPTEVQLNAQQDKQLPVPCVESTTDKKLDLEEEMNSFSNLPDPLFLFDNSDQSQLLELDFI
ncbi:hypothetical protein TVAG_447330 [Trichomonas vaginalis G3]|uniref:Initiator binding domain-containing protein n=1 Tax=Trichomonas vaginalis (strain ATCC PRA-98 / G3) TaxID=412133 RepID=A2DS04_TRIV3|nr:transcription-initiator DNA-binding domain ibd family [Trichomonas vaginalis G3]EAY16774.1 hypothetical protein TVAG_447330 [Trichomonas vaginalis G3]KAI5490820.1 transcription-initiator DNA-binding domain ibd family [Trichomonas vaginalis G3]|eukprot:XP_001328997.1 hypothetical protein [Trichomonas vaginalis G3]